MNQLSVMASFGGKRLCTAITLGIFHLGGWLAHAAGPLLPLGNALVDPSFVSALPSDRLATTSSIVRFKDGSVAALFGPLRLPTTGEFDYSTVALVKTLKDGSRDPVFVPKIDLTSIVYGNPGRAPTLLVDDEDHLSILYYDKDINPHSETFAADGTVIPARENVAVPALASEHFTLTNGNDLEVRSVSEYPVLKITYLVTTPAHETVSTETQDVRDGLNEVNTYGLSFLTDARGGVLVVFDRIDSSFNGLGNSVITRLHENGTVDTETLPQLFTGSISLSREPDSDKLRLIESVTAGIHVRTTTISYRRLLPSLALDPAYGGLSYSTAYDVNHKNEEYIPNGKTFFDGFFKVESFYGDPESGNGSFSVLRYDKDAQPDENFKVARINVDHFSATNNEDLIHVTPLPDGRLFVTGSFSTIQGVASPHAAYLYPAVHDARTRLTNLSLRAATSSDEGNVIIGFTTTGTGSRAALLRAAGPALLPFGVVNALSDPDASLYAGSTPIAFNDNWGGNETLATLAAQTGAFPFDSASADAALSATLGEGPHSLVIRPTRGGPGVVLGELYDASPASEDFNTVRLSNLSARALVGAGDETLIAGFTLQGTNTKRVLLRAVGPGLAPFRISGAVTDPILAVYRGSQKFAENNDWSGEATDSELFTAVGAFPLEKESKDAAITLTLAPGSYTVHVSNADTTTGVALLEVYEVP